MPDLATRTDHEEEVALLILLYLQELEDTLAAGGMPDLLNWTVQLQAELAPHLAATYLEAAEQLASEHGGYLVDADERARQWAGQQAAWIAQGMASTTRDNLWLVDDPSELAWDFGLDRVLTVAATETNEAISQGQHYAASELAALAIMLIPVWQSEGDDRVCPVCSPLDRQRQNVWQGAFPTGPPAHPNCRCWMEWVRV